MHRDRIAEMRPPIAIDANHFARLFALSSMTSEPMTEVCEYLREELDRAHVLPAEKLRPDIVSLGSQVKFRDEQTGKIQEIILVYPLDADIARRRVSVLTPVGAALLGLSVNQTISFAPEPAKGANDRAQGRSCRLARYRNATRSAVGLSSRSCFCPMQRRQRLVSRSRSVTSIQSINWRSGLAATPRCRGRAFRM